MCNLHKLSNFAPKSPDFGKFRRKGTNFLAKTLGL